MANKIQLLNIVDEKKRENICNQFVDVFKTQKKSKKKELKGMDTGTTKKTLQ